MQFLEVITYVEKGDALPGKFADDIMQAGKVLAADEGGDFPQNDQAAAPQHCFKDLHHKPLKGGQMLHIVVGGKIHP